MSSIWTESLASCPWARAPGSLGQPTKPVLRFQSRPSTRAGDGQPRGRRRGADQPEATRVLGCSLAWHLVGRCSGSGRPGSHWPGHVSAIGRNRCPSTGYPCQNAGATGGGGLAGPPAQLVRRHSQQPGLVVPLSLRGAIPAPTVIRLERHPAPGDLAGVGQTSSFRVCLARILGVPRKPPGSVLPGGDGEARKRRSPHGRRER